MPPFEQAKSATGAADRRHQAGSEHPPRWERLKAVFLDALEHARALGITAQGNIVGDFVISGKTFGFLATPVH